MGFLDVLFGRKRLPEARRDDLFALATAAVTLDVELGLKPAPRAGVCFKPLSAGDFTRVENEMTMWAKHWNQFADRHDADVTSHLTESDRNKIERIRDAKEKNVDRAYAEILSNNLKQMGITPPPFKWLYLK